MKKRSRLSLLPFLIGPCIAAACDGVDDRTVQEANAGGSAGANAGTAGNMDSAGGESSGGASSGGTDGKGSGGAAAGDGGRDGAMAGEGGGGGSQAVTINLIPPDYDFGILNEGTSSEEQVFTIQNVAESSTGQLTATIVGAFDDQFEILMNGCNGLVLRQNDTCTLEVRFNAELAGQRSVALEITGPNDAFGTAALSGVSVGVLGRECSNEEHCQSVNCVDGVCCDEAAVDCTDCRACNLEGSVGTCAPIPAGDDPNEFCAAGTCATGACDGNGACGATGAGTVCKSSCSNSTLSEYRCTGNSPTCPVSGPTNTVCPGGYACANEIECADSCANDLGCNEQNFCNGSTCTAKRPDLGSCDRDRQCISDLCDGTKCVDCYAGRIGCGVFGGPYCVNDGGANYCARCSFVPSYTCAQAGTGSSCDPDNDCQCTSDSQCTSPDAPYCRSDQDGSHCACFQGSSYYEGCPRQRPVCVNPNANNAQDACKGNSQSRCTVNSDCVSNMCVGGNCN